VRDSLDAVKALRQLAPRLHDLFQRLLSDSLHVVSARFEPLHPRVKVTQARVKDIKASKDPFLERTASRTAKQSGQ
jgi:hypothetical protein